MAKRREPDQNGEHQEPDRELTAWELMVQKALGSGDDFGLPDDPARVQIPNVWEWMTRCKLGAYRFSPARFMVQLVPTGVLLQLVCSDLKRSAEYSGEHLLDAIMQMEAGLSSGKAVIRQWGKGDFKLRKSTQQIDFLDFRKSDS